jgi:AcrR family transcriptional regulator
MGYHFGSKETLMNTALIEATEEFGDELNTAMPTNLTAEATPVERFQAIWANVVALFTANRELWAANFEILAQIEHAPEIRSALVGANKEARDGLAMLFQQLDSEKDPHGAWEAGCFHQALLTGVMAQWLGRPADRAIG